jgi:RNA polymerase sigma-70 factor (ECF subfamily)
MVIASINQDNHIMKCDLGSMPLGDPFLGSNDNIDKPFGMTRDSNGKEVFTMVDKRVEEDRLDREDLRAFLDAAEEIPRRRAASRLFERHQARIYSWCHRYVGNHDHALELAQDVMLNAYRGLPGYVHRARFSSWLFVITRNRCIREVSRKSLVQELEIDVDSIPSGIPGPDKRMEDTQHEKNLWNVIDKHLNTEEVDALRLRCIDGLPVDAITDILTIQDRSGARGVLQRARRKLRTALDRPEGN